MSERTRSRSDNGPRTRSGRLSAASRRGRRIARARGRSAGRRARHTSFRFPTRVAESYEIPLGRWYCPAKSMSNVSITQLFVFDHSNNEALVRKSRFFFPDDNLWRSQVFRRSYWCLEKILHTNSRDLKIIRKDAMFSFKTFEK